MALQASSKVKGITIEIGADTTSFGYAMKQIRQEASLVSKDLKTVDSALKLDPTNLGKAADKLKLLREAADNATTKVETITITGGEDVEDADLIAWFEANAVMQ